MAASSGAAARAAARARAARIMPRDVVGAVTRDVEGAVTRDVGGHTKTRNPASSHAMAALAGGCPPVRPLQRLLCCWMPGAWTMVSERLA